MNLEDAIIQAALAQAERLRERHGEPQEIVLSIYGSDADLRQLRPEDGIKATAKDQRRIAEKVAHELRSRGFIVAFVRLKAADFLKWLSETGKPNNAATRAEFMAWKTN